MRAFRILALVLGLTVGLPLGCMVLFAAMQLQDVIQKTKPAPNVLQAAQLIENGSSENLHVELTGFTFGAPVIETNKDGWECAWLPVEPDPKPKTTPKTGKRTLFYRANVQDQAALDAFVKQSKLAAMVTTPLPEGSRWRVTFGRALRKAYPDLETKQTLFLAEPRLGVLDYSLALSDPRLYDVEYQSVAAWGGAGLLLLGLFCLYMLVARRGPEAGARQGSGISDADALRAQLSAERPVSFHEAKALYILMGVCLFGILAGFLLLLALLLCLGAVLKNQVEGKPLLAVMSAFFTLSIFIGAWAAARACRHRWRWPTDIAVCYTGLRWRQGRRQRAILWAEVADVERDIKLVQRVNQTGLVGAFAQLNNPQPPIKIDTLKIALHSGETYRMSPSTVADYFKFAGNVGKLWSEDVKKTDFSGVTEAWRIAQGIGKESRV